MSHVNPHGVPFDNVKELKAFSEVIDKMTREGLTPLFSFWVGDDQTAVISSAFVNDVAADSINRILGTHGVPIEQIPPRLFDEMKRVAFEAIGLSILDYMAEYVKKRNGGVPHERTEILNIKHEKGEGLFNSKN